MEPNDIISTIDVAAGRTAAACDHCLPVEGESGDGGACRCSPTSEPIPLETLGADTALAQLTPDIVDALVCELGQRPGGAPTIAQLVESVTALQRGSDSLMVEFDPTARERVTAVVNAEQLCCATLGWHLETDPVVRLRVSGKPLQLDALEGLFGDRATR